MINIGEYQGDSQAGKVFTLTLAGALNHIRAVMQVTIPRPNPPISENGIPLESAYSDDSELLDVKGKNLPKILETACDILKDWSLFVNESKTVFTRVYLAGMSEVDSNDNKIRGNVEPRDTVLLGSKLCSERTLPTDATRLMSLFTLTRTSGLTTVLRSVSPESSDYTKPW